MKAVHGDDRVLPPVKRVKLLDAPPGMEYHKGPAALGLQGKPKTPAQLREETRQAAGDGNLGQDVQSNSDVEVPATDTNTASPLATPSQDVTSSSAQSVHSTACNSGPAVLNGHNGAVPQDISFAQQEKVPLDSQGAKTWTRPQDAPQLSKETARLASSVSAPKRVSSYQVLIPTNSACVVQTTFSGCQNTEKQLVHGNSDGPELQPHFLTVAAVQQHTAQNLRVSQQTLDTGRSYTTLSEFAQKLFTTPASQSQDTSCSAALSSSHSANQQFPSVE